MGLVEKKCQKALFGENSEAKAQKEIITPT